MILSSRKIGITKVPAIMQEEDVKERSARRTLVANNIKILNGGFMKFLVLLLFLLLTIGCSNSSGPTPEPNIIWNLQVGNNWTFLDSIFTINGVQVESAYTEIIKQININYQGEDITLSCLHEESIDDNSNNRTDISDLYKNETEGLFHYGKLYESGDSVYYEISKNLLFKYPVEVGEIWSFENDSIECIGKQTDLLTPYGNFKCHVYKLFKDEENITYYCVPYIGIVGSIIEYNENSFRKRLLSYFNIGE